MKIPYVNLAAQHQPLKDELIRAAGRVIDHGRFILGPEVEELENRFAELCRVKHAVGLNSGTDAIILALAALGIGPGDEVVTAPNSFYSSAGAIALVGAKPVFVDVGPDYNLDPSLIQAALTDRTKAILPVHLTGRPTDMDPIIELARKHGLAVIEDAAQAVSARYHDRPVGGLGQVGCFSLHPLKTLNACGDAGMAVTDDDDLAEQLRTMRNIGLENRETCRLWSGNSRLDTMQAALVLVKLDYLHLWTERRRANAAHYRRALAGLDDLVCPDEKEHEYCVYHTFVVLAERRDELKAYLAENGIGTSIHYPRLIPFQPAAADLGYEPGDFPTAEYQSKRILSLPVYPELTRDQLDHIAETIWKFYKGKKQ